MFDNVCKFLAETYSSDFAAWLLGESTPLTELSPSELSLEPIRADALILLQSEELVLHLEFQTEPNINIPFRMADYRLRVHRRFPLKRMRQIVIYLRPSNSELVYETRFTLDNLQHRFEVIRLWEQSPNIFLNSPGLLPLAVLGQTQNPEQVLQTVAEQVEAIAEPRERSNLAAVSGILAGLVLNEEIIRRFLRQEIMRESAFYQEIEAQGLQQGLQQGLAQGLQQGLAQGLRQEALTLTLRQLVRRLRLTSLSDVLHSRIEQLPLEQLEDLGEALLDFQELSDLEAWLEQY
jgi:predicted transposase/invertase (TIGR01784 family)